MGGGGTDYLHTRANVHPHTNNREGDGERRRKEWKRVHTYLLNRTTPGLADGPRGAARRRLVGAAWRARSAHTRFDSLDAVSPSLLVLLPSPRTPLSHSLSHSLTLTHTCAYVFGLCISLSKCRRRRTPQSPRALLARQHVFCSQRGKSLRFTASSPSNPPLLAAGQRGGLGPAADRLEGESGERKPR